MDKSSSQLDCSSSDPRETALAEALAFYVDQQNAGEELDIEAYCRQHSHLMPELENHLLTLRKMDDALGPGGEEAPGDPEISPPPELKGYRLLDPLGHGGMGQVYLAEDEHLRRKVAIKFLLPRLAVFPELRERFLREARILAGLKHPNLVHVYALGEGEVSPFFVMEYVEGKPLTETAQALPLEAKLRLMLKVIQTVAFVHERHILHRDLKPGNILAGADLEPKLLDLGLALPLETDEKKITQVGQRLGTLDYFSPEQAGAGALDPRSDVFSLGIILYELLTGTLPFRGATQDLQMASLCGEDPLWPRRLNPQISRDLQNICLKALEKDPEHRYVSAREMADDLARCLAGEAVVALPTSYSRHLAGKIEQHLRDIEGWGQDHLISPYEVDAFRKRYSKLTEPEDAWLLSLRRLSLSNLSLYLGAWIIIVGSSLLVFFQFLSFQGTPAVLTVATLTSAMAWLGRSFWQQDRRRTGIAFLLGFCLLLTVASLLTMCEYGWQSHWTQGKKELEFFLTYFDFGRLTNARLWWALVVSLPAYVLLRRFTGSPVFSLGVAFMSALFFLASMLRLGLLEWLETDQGRLFFYCLPVALAYLGGGFILEKVKKSSDSPYLFGHAVVFTYAGLSGVALYHKPYAEWLKNNLPWTRGDLEYLFILNAGLYFLLQLFCEHSPSAQMRTVAKAYRFVIAGHILVPLLLLGLSSTDRWNKNPANLILRNEAWSFEILLPLAALVIFLFSIPKQTRNYTFTGLIFLAIGIIRLSQDLLKNSALWPLSLMIAGLGLMLVAAYYAPLRLLGRNWFSRLFKR